MKTKGKLKILLVDQNRTRGQRWRVRKQEHPFGTTSASSPPVLCVRLLEQIEAATVHRGGNMVRRREETQSGTVWHLKDKILNKIQWP